MIKQFPTEKAQKIKLVALDVDGVLTDGGIVLHETGSESKRFYVRDGLGIRLLARAGITVGLITARHSQLVVRRGQELNLAFVHQGIKNKWAALQGEMNQRNLVAWQCAYMGDDLVDLDLLSRVGLSATPADGQPEVMERVDWIASHKGGWGAVRELAEQILKARGEWSNLVQSFLPAPEEGG
ncbi:MAG: HAD-IIIA family hydrolase [Magnetococcales bacterium]|nr:HAD-IIIA family hydrolase [Magnetococcales bacterium]NGZ26787.1 HAD-IIIA family hydrolase [Magnetococcales bacterium]